jgi:hypothetical protein
MSLNELVLNDLKPWLNIQANNLTIDGNLSVRGAQQNYILGYNRDGHATFSPQRRIVNLDLDGFGVIPLQNVGEGTLDFELGPIPENNFEIDINKNLKCLNGGVYILILKFIEGQTNAGVESRPNPYISVNNSQTGTMSLRLPLCTSQIPNHSGSQMTALFLLNPDDEIVLNLAIQPSGTINMMNEYFGSNLLLIKIA